MNLLTGRDLLSGRDLTSAFDHAAAFYDRFVAANPGYHAHLRRSARRLRLPRDGDGDGDGDGEGLHLLDLGCGTGASTAALLRAAPRARITAVDASEGMLRRARAKQWPDGVDFVHAPAEGLAEAGVTGPFDAVFAGYLFRNLTDPGTVLADVHDLLVPGGAIAVHEYTLSGAPAHRSLWSAVCWGVVIPTGSLRGDGALYRHLWRSALGFDTAEAFRARMRRAGFARVRVLPMTGWQWGIVHTHLAQRPRRAGEGGAT